jgi:hypothetical protein
MFGKKCMKMRYNLRNKSEFCAKLRICEKVQNLREKMRAQDRNFLEGVNYMLFEQVPDVIVNRLMKSI